jgi:hypothetical protein
VNDVAFLEKLQRQKKLLSIAAYRLDVKTNFVAIFLE